MPYPDPDSPGYCHILNESTYANNLTDVTITIPTNPASTVSAH